ncbi:aromatic amino acid DMT transporter YddG [Wohlfahrtiimonas populi]|uniref:aromatic amino acid DMT transporter YddG n=1 Tax=Wohlfahrtiimonas populi TaxID=1940240 RepID=UPI00098D0EB7|nr:aromatic amino acid DMT transporter YddG [Wohlfahrtiimonas populi]
MTKTKATFIGLIAIVLWSFIVALIRVVSKNFGTVGGAALMYTVASVFLLFSVGFPIIRHFPKKYLIIGAILFVAYEICLALSIGYANNGRQAIEVGMINYLWPTLTIIASILFNQQKTTWLVIPGFIISMVGITWVLGDESGLNFYLMFANIQENPMSYILAFVGAIIWSAYCVVTAKYAEGKNGITLFFILVAITLWIQYAFVGVNEFNFTWKSTLYLLLAASALGFGYAAWNVGILHGNVMVLATASYFIPIFSAFFAAMVLNATLSLGFWQGVIMICIGSLCCFIATRKR